MSMEFIEEYMGVLQNIEFALLSSVEDHPELTDHDMLNVIEQLINYYKFQPTGDLSSAKRKLNPVQQEILETVNSMCESKLGIQPPPIKEMVCDPITQEELLLCLKRIEKSIKFWSKQGGRKGYITFVSQSLLIK